MILNSTTQWMKSLIRVAAVVTVAAGAFIAVSDAAAQGDFAWIDLARIAGESTDGQAANARVQQLSEQKLAEIQARNAEAQGQVNALTQQLQESQQKLQQGQNVISVEAAATLQREISRLQVDVQRTTQDSNADIARLTEDAEAEVQSLQVQLQRDFEQRLLPAIDKMAADKGLSFIFNAAQGLVWADPSMDITQELIDVLNGQ